MLWNNRSGNGRVNLRQLRYIVDIAERNLNISATAAALHTSQSGISKQVRLLETELGVDIFVRAGSRLSGVTAIGAKVIATARAALVEVGNIRAVSRENVRTESGRLTIATSHTQARYLLPEIMKAFTRLHPKVGITLRHGDPGQIAELVQKGQADIGVTTDAARGPRELLAIPCRQFQRVIIVPPGHALLRSRRVTLKNVCRYPLVTYEPQFTGRWQVVEAFEKQGLTPTLVISAIDADVIKTCVEQGLGIAVLSEVTFDPRRDSGLRAIPAGHLFAPSTTSLLVHRKRHLHPHAYDFIELCAPRWNKAGRQRA